MNLGTDRCKKESAARLGSLGRTNGEVGLKGSEFTPLATCCVSPVVSMSPPFSSQSNSWKRDSGHWVSRSAAFMLHVHNHDLSLYQALNEDSGGVCVWEETL